MNNGLKVYVLVKTYGLADILAKCAAAQAGHETGGFTSALFKSDNNCFGMTFVGQGFATKSKKSFIDTTGKRVYYASYLTFEASVADFVSWWTKHRANIFSFPIWVGSLSGYVSFLKNQKYFEATEDSYLKGCQYYMSLYFDEKE